VTRQYDDGTSTEHVPDWREEAACLEHDPELFFPIGKSHEAKLQLAVALRVCWEECSVRGSCLDEALDNRIAWGVWGGKSEDERDAIQRERNSARRRQRRLAV
jgi:WhiB family redox-sensing transcriptional regulator